MDKFIKKIIFGRTIQAAFQRGNIYANSNSLSKKDKDELKKSIKDELEKISNNYINNIPENKKTGKFGGHNTNFLKRVRKREVSSFREGPGACISVKRCWYSL